MHASDTSPPTPPHGTKDASQDLVPVYIQDKGPVPVAPVYRFSSQTTSGDQLHQRKSAPGGTALNWPRTRVLVGGRQVYA
jgi:hypothetical protein